MNTGAPMKDVTIPTGISDGEIIVLAIVSEITRNIEPSSIEHGMLYLLSLPIISFEIFGTINPTNEIIPATDTAEAASNEANAIDNL